jgi:hypothetical protein
MTMTTRRLPHCSNRTCSNLVYSDEAVPGTKVGRLFGYYCHDCAGLLGWWSPYLLAELERSLSDAGLIGGPRPGDRVPKVTKKRPPKLTEGQMTLL